jgi:2-oxoglutarate ferredoxin oxidoreductase subunit beta
VTFRPDQRDWKNMVHPAPVAATNDPAVAARRIMTDDGFNLGVLYRGDRVPYRPPVGGNGVELSELEKEFEI